ncbi:ABC transporter ATP-binding protein [Bremerella sp. JC770]|uniref:ABC transporter ATP-binding protein n=1 Tax=Bremerella sp. JC770 TaxID=3232137 RepID=UPI00345A1E0B
MIKTVDLTKKYGDFFAIKGIELDLDQGDVFGFIGPNGAGKTTTMRIIATLLNPTWGEAYVCGNSIYTKPKEIRRLVGYMPDFFGVYDDMKVIEYLEFFAAAYRINGKERAKVCNEMLELVDLEFKRNAFANTLSRGQTQRLGLARVMLHNPQVLLLDEPASGLDPRARIQMRNLLKRLRDMGKTIIVSSHILPELADVCNKIGIIDRGVLEVNASVAEVMKQVKQKTTLLVSVSGDNDAAGKVLEQAEIVESIESRVDHLLVTLTKEAEDYSDLPTMLVQAGHKITMFREEEINLESAFMALTKGMGQQVSTEPATTPVPSPSQGEG